LRVQEFGFSLQHVRETGSRETRKRRQERRKDKKEKRGPTVSGSGFRVQGLR